MQAEAEPGERFPHGTILVLGIITIAAYGAWFYAFGVLLDPILVDTGWSETGLAATFSISAALGALGAVPAGRFVDRYSSRPAFLLAAGAGMAGIWFASYADSLLAFAVGAIVAGASLQGLSFYHITQATSVRVAPGQPTKAIALLTIYGAFSSAIYLPLAAFLVTEVGWRQTMRLLATLTAVVLVVGAFVVRERRPSTRTRATPGFGLAFGKPAAKRYVIASALTGFGVGVMLVYQVPLMTAAGLSVGTAAWMAGARGAAQITGRIPLTFIVDRIGPRAAVQMSFAAITMAVVVLAFAGNVAVALVYVAIAGFGIGAASPLQGIYGTELFDEAHLGASMGVITMVFGLANAVGPTIVGLLAEVSGSRWWGVALVATAGLVAVATMSAPSQPEAVEQP
ncbi:MAG: MFS transporter [Acidimicrobiales bacterium]